MKLATPSAQELEAIRQHTRKDLARESGLAPNTVRVAVAGGRTHTLTLRALLEAADRLAQRSNPQPAVPVRAA
jgi:hypothetical protein